MNRKMQRGSLAEHTPELQQDLDLHEKNWQLKRKLWLLLSSILVLATLISFTNVFLDNPKSKIKGVSVQYDHILRRDAPMEVSFHCEGAKGVNLVAIPHQYMMNFKLEKILPEPTERIITMGRILYRFHNKVNQQVVFYLTPKSTGSVEASWGINEDAVKFSHFIYP